MKASAQRRKSRAQIAEEKLLAQQKEAEIADKMARFDQMEAQMVAAQAGLDQVGGMKGQIDNLLDGGYILKNPDGTLGVSQSEEQRAFYAESAAKQPRAMDQLNIMAAQSAVRNLEGQFLEEAQSEADGGQF